MEFIGRPKARPATPSCNGRPSRNKQVYSSQRPRRYKAAVAAALLLHPTRPLEIVSVLHRLHFHFIVFPPVREGGCTQPGPPMQTTTATVYRSLPSPHVLAKAAVYGAIQTPRLDRHCTSNDPLGCWMRHGETKTQPQRSLSGFFAMICRVALLEVQRPATRSPQCKLG
jgi:hypothetical protein